MSLEQVISDIGTDVDLAGVAVTVVGVAGATVLFARSLVRRNPAAYTSYRRSLGRAILLGLELLVAGDIIRTVAVRPSFTSVGVLAVIVAVRTLLSFTLEAEVNGRWPWQHGRGSEPV
jgi:uncharacterized membrane protein